ncbi:3-isopropylmalate dehydratase [candidate division WOR-3 bacterium]|nr:3-isopropylmalate dehydratase [candidate division WOR-3 bacterium]TET76918.1 MAG: 3-isopropylmalate dehydratase [Candidatus Cloacimonadota bacterium]
MEGNNVIKGRVWVIKDERGNAIDSIDTDQIFHNKFLTITDKEKMKDYAFSNLSGWIDFPSKAKEGDILVVGKNFGAGSSRQQAVDCFSSLGIRAIVGESFGAIYKRNAINSGFPLIECQDITRKLKTGDNIAIDPRKGEIHNIASGEILQCKPFSNIQWEIYKAGGLFNINLT